MPPRSYSVRLTTAKLGGMQVGLLSVRLRVGVRKVSVLLLR